MKRYIYINMHKEAPTYQMSQPLDQNCSFEDITPIVKSIYADNGEDYIYITNTPTVDGILGKTIIEEYAVYDADEEDSKLIFLNAKVELLKELPNDFKKALDFSENMVQIELIFEPKNKIKCKYIVVGETYGVELEFVVIEE